MTTVAAIVSLYFVNAVSPGPNLILILQAAMSRGRRSAVGVAMGVTSGSSILALAVVLGLNSLLVGHPLLTMTLQTISAEYITFLGFRALWEADRRTFEVRAKVDAARAGYLRGLTTVVTNPQTALFFAGTLTVAIPPGTSVGLRLAGVVAIAATSVCCHGGAAVTISGASIRRSMLRFEPFIALLLGSLMIVFGLRMIYSIGEHLV